VAREQLKSSLGHLSMLGTASAQSLMGAAMARDVEEPVSTTQTHMSWLQLNLECRRVRAILDQRRHDTTLHLVTPDSALQQSSPAQHTMEVRKLISSVSWTGPHIPNLLTAMVCATLVMNGQKLVSWWTRALNTHH